MNKQVISLLGSPSVGKSSLSMKLTGSLISDSLNAAYVEEFIKDYANRNIPLSPADQLFVFGGQIFKMNGSLSAGYEYIVSCTSPVLCSFYANHYGNYKFMSLVSVTEEWMEYWKGQGVTFKFFFLRLTKEQYEQRHVNIGRYESLSYCINLQENLLNFVERNYKKLDLTVIDGFNTTAGDLKKWIL